MRRALTKTANAVRRLMIRTGGDRVLAELANWLPAGLPARLFPDVTLYPRPTLRRVVRDGVRLDLDVSDYVQWIVYYSTEKKQRERLYALVPPGGVAIDIGSNIGQILLNFALRVGPDGRAIGFEANPDTYDHCRSNMALNGFCNIEVHPVGLGHVEGELHLGRRSAGNSGADAFTTPGIGTVKVPVTTLDRFVERAGLNRIDLIKIDVEGFETNVLSGAQATLQRFRPQLFVELCDGNLRAQGSSAAQLVRFLEKQGYTLSEVEGGAAITSGDDFRNCFLDIIGVPVSTSR